MFWIEVYYLLFVYSIPVTFLLNIPLLLVPIFKIFIYQIQFKLLIYNFRKTSKTIYIHNFHTALNMLEQSIKENLKIYPNILVGKIGCPYCEDAIQTLVTKKKYFLYVPKETNDNLSEDVKNTYKHKTLPAIFLNGDFIGGFDDLRQKLNDPKYF